MDPIARYVVGVAVCGAMIVTFYRTALYGRVSFRAARAFLVGAIVLSAAIPALKIPVWRSAPIEIPYNMAVAEALPPVEPAMSVEPEVNWLPIGLWGLYGAGVAAVLVVMVWQAAAIRRLRRASVIERVGDAQVAVSQQVSAPFSFLGTIFIPPHDIQDARGADAGASGIQDGRGAETGANRTAISGGRDIPDGKIAAQGFGKSHIADAVSRGMSGATISVEVSAAESGVSDIADGKSAAQGFGESHIADGWDAETGAERGTQGTSAAGASGIQDIQDGRGAEIGANRTAISGANDIADADADVDEVSRGKSNIQDARGGDVGRVASLGTLDIQDARGREAVAENHIADGWDAETGANRTAISGRSYIQDGKSVAQVRAESDIADRKSVARMRAASGIADGRGAETGANRATISGEVRATGNGAISAQDLGRIVAHEQSHVRHRHSIERIAAQALTAFVWWSPAAWWALRLLKEVHEFEADNDVLRDGCTVDEYLPLIFRQVFGVVPYTAAGMAHSLTKKRFEMMRKSLKHNKLSALRVAGVLPVIGAGLMLFGFTERTPEIVYTDAKTAQEVPQMPAQPALEVPQAPEKTTLEVPQAPDEPLMKAEVMPKFEGGDLIAFRNWVMRQLVYPKEAMQNNVSGKVALKFVIDKQGNVSTVEVLASPSELLSAEAVRVVKSSPKWTPGMNGGKPVSVFYILPVEFALMGDTEPVEPLKAENEVDKMQVVGYAADPQTPRKSNVEVTQTADGRTQIEVTSSEPLRLGDGVPANFDGLLVLVNGKKVKNLDDVDPETVETIEVLKDAAAVEKFGRRAKDGVISVTTKPDMVDIGYGRIERRRNTGAVGEVDMSSAVSYTNLRDYIRGRVAGVQFVGDQLIIRGFNSINSGLEALIVVDGVPMSSFADANAAINPADVASISVLKDAGSTGIYGVRGANGVVLIRTKGGR